MLKLVRSSRRTDDWDDRYDDESRRREDRGQRRSVAGRVAFTVTFAGLLMCAGLAAYLLTRDPEAAHLLATSAPKPAPAAPAPASAKEQSQMPTEAPQAADPTPAGGATRPQTQGQQIPGLQSLLVFARNSITALGQANAADNYAVLWGIAAPELQKANSPAALSKVFTDLRSRKIDLGEALIVDPRLYTPPATNRDGLLRLNGFFPFARNPIDFDLIYQPIDGGWRLFGISVQPSKAPGAPPPEAAKPPAKPAKPAKPVMPDQPTMIKLIRGTVIALNQANMTGDYSVARALAAPGFRDANSAEQLGAIFANLRARQLDLSPVAVISPRLSSPAMIDEKGYLRLTGYFPSRPEQVNFDLAFQQIDGVWQLFGIGLNTSVDTSGNPAPSGAD